MEEELRLTRAADPIAQISAFRMSARAGAAALLLALTAGCSATQPDRRSESHDEAEPKAMAATAPAEAEKGIDQPSEPANATPSEPAEIARDEALPDLANAQGDSDAPPFPDEVTAFLVDRDGCDHFRGEEPYDEDRRAFLDDNIRQLCTGTDARLADLRHRYARNPDVIAALASYEDRIESGPAD